MKNFTLLLFASFLAVSSYAQVDILKLADNNIENGNYLLSHVPGYCIANLGIDESHLSVSTDVVNSGSEYSLLLDYSGSWESNFVENAAWNPIDISSYNNLKLTVYAPTELSDNQIPSLVLVYSNELSWDGKEKSLSDYINPIPAGKWMEINIPVTDLGATHLSENTGVNLCCTGWPAALENPGKLYVDKIQFTTNSGTSIPDISLISSKPYYADGEIRLNGYQGEFSLIDPMGHLRYYIEKTIGDIAIDLPQGIYFMKTEKSVTKIMIP